MTKSQIKEMINKDGLQATFNKMRNERERRKFLKVAYESNNAIEEYLPFGLLTAWEK